MVNSGGAERKDDIPLRTAVVVAAIALAATLLRAAGLGNLPLWYDEAMYTLLAQALDWRLLSGHDILVEPMFVGPLALWLEFGQSTFWVRLPMALAGIATVGVAADLARHIAGQRAALHAALFTVAAPVLVYYSRDAKMYSFVLLYVLLACYFAIRFGKEQRLNFLVGYFLTGALLCHTHFSAPLFLGTLGLVFIPLFTRRFQTLAVWALTNVAIVIAAIPFILAELKYQEMMQGKSFHAMPPTLEAVKITVTHFFAGYTPNLALAFAITFFSLALILCALFLRFREWPALLLLLAAGTVPVLILYTISVLAPWSLYIDRYVIGCAGPMLVLAALGSSTLHGRACRSAVLAGVLLLSGMALRDVYSDRLPDRNEWRRGIIDRSDVFAIAAALREHGAPGELVCHPFWESHPMLRWHAPEFEHVLADQNGRMQETLARICTPGFQEVYGWDPKDVRPLLTPGRRVWIVVTEEHGGVSDAYGALHALLERRGELIYSQRFGAPFAKMLLEQFKIREDGAAASSFRPRKEIALSNESGGGTFTVALEPSDAQMKLTATSTAEAPLAMEFEAIPCVAWLGGGDMEPVLVGESSWSTKRYLAGGTMRIGTVVRAHAQAARDDVLLGKFAAPAGQYEVMIHRTQQGNGYMIPTARIDVRLGEQLFQSDGVKLERGGWRWESIGTFENTSGEAEVQIQAWDSEGRPEAYAVLAGIMLVPSESESAASEAGAPANITLKRGRLDVAAGGSAATMLPCAQQEHMLLLFGMLQREPFVLTQQCGAGG